MESRKTYLIKRRQEIFESGRCDFCLKMREQVDRRACNQCLARRNRESKNLRAKRQAMNLCKSCGKVKPVKGRLLCVTCAAKSNLGAVKNYAKPIEESHRRQTALRMKRKHLVESAMRTYAKIHVIDEILNRSSV